MEGRVEKGAGEENGRGNLKQFQEREGKPVKRGGFGGRTSQCRERGSNSEGVGGEIA